MTFIRFLLTPDASPRPRQQCLPPCWTAVIKTVQARRRARSASKGGEQKVSDSRDSGAAKNDGDGGLESGLWNGQNTRGKLIQVAAVAQQCREIQGNSKDNQHDSEPDGNSVCGLGLNSLCQGPLA